MKKKRNFSRKSGEKVFKARLIVKAVLRNRRRLNRLSANYGLEKSYGESYNQKEKDVIMDCLKFRTEGRWEEPWDGDYYYELKPCAKFHKLVPRMHKYYEVREWLDENEPLHKKHQEAYARDICRLGVTREIELSFINAKYWHYGGPWYKTYYNVLRRMHKYGHKFSPEAREQMKRHCWDLYIELYPEECPKT